MSDIKDSIAAMSVEIQKLEDKHNKQTIAARITHQEIVRKKRELASLEKALDDERTQRSAKEKAMRDTVKQDQIVSVLRKIGSKSAAGPICKGLLEMYNIKIQGHQFAGAYLDAILKDDRIKVTYVNESMNKYSLTEWDR